MALKWFTWLSSQDDLRPSGKAIGGGASDTASDARDQMWSVHLESGSSESPTLSEYIQHTIRSTWTSAWLDIQHRFLIDPAYFGSSF